MISLQVLRPVLVIDNTLTSTSIKNAASANTVKQLKDLVDTKSNLNSPVFTGTPSAPNPLSNDNTTRIATCNFVQTVTAGIEGSFVATANTYADGVSLTAENNAKSYADGVSLTAENNAKSYADGVSLTAENNAKSYADSLVIGLLDDRGNYNPTISLAYPTSANNGSGVAGAVLRGDLWTISTNGTIGSVAVTTGDTVRALVDNPGQTASNWAITENNIIYVPENSNNKSSAPDLGGGSPSNTLYPTQAAVKSYVDTNALTSTTARYTFNLQTDTDYTIETSDITANGRVIVKCTNAAAIAVTIANPTTLLGGVAADHVGKSVNIRQGGAGVVTISGALEGIGTFTAQHETKTLIAQSNNTWLVVGG